MTNTKGQYKGEFGEVAPSDAVNHEPEKKFPPVPEKDRYEARVKDIAEELAKTDNPGSWLGEDEFIIKKYEPLARIAVKHMAEEYMAGYESGFLDREGEKDEEKAVEKHWRGEVFQAARGLIPSPDQPEEPGK